MTTAPILVTYDVHVTNFPLDVIRRAFHVVLAEHERNGMAATFFFPAEAARLLRPELDAVVAAGHEVGCHGLTHRSGDVYDRLPADEQRVRLRQATTELEDLVQRPIRTFRAPAFRLSGATLRALDELGYEADVSMNSQRLGLLSSDPWNVSWMLAPRRPYHPDAERPWRRGKLRLWEIPLSCALLPFMSKGLMVLGLAPMSWFFRALLAESHLTGKPIVFMTHPEEFLADRETPPPRPFAWRHLLPSTYGIEFRHALEERDPRIIAERSRALYDRMRACATTEALTASAYVRRLNGIAG